MSSSVLCGGAAELQIAVGGVARGRTRGGKDVWVLLHFLFPVHELELDQERVSHLVSRVSSFGQCCGVSIDPLVLQLGAGWLFC